MALNEISTFTVLEWRGEVPAYADRIERLEWAGVDGARYRRLGKVGGPFQLVSIVDTATITTGRALLNSYASLKTAGLVVLKYRGVDFNALESLKVVVIDVVQQALHPVLQWSGALDDSSKARLEAVWTLEFRHT